METRKHFGSLFQIPLFHVHPSSPSFSSLRRMHRLRRYALSDWQRRQGLLSSSIAFLRSGFSIQPLGSWTARNGGSYQSGSIQWERGRREECWGDNWESALGWSCLSMFASFFIRACRVTVLSLLMAFLKKSKDSQSHVSFPSILSTTLKFRPFSNQLS